MLLEEMTQKVVDYGNQLISSGLTIGTAGNISMYDPETGYMVISPSGIPYAKTTAEDVVVMDLQGNIVDSKRTPSSEHSLHAAFYLEKPDARAVVHAHSMYCTTLACAGVDLKLFVELEVIETEPGFAGNTAQGATKPATVETGAQVMVPLFVNQGDKLKIDTRTGEYLSRV